MTSKMTAEGEFYERLKGTVVDIGFIVGDDNLTGILAWVDVCSIGVNLSLGGAQVLLYKHSIKRISQRIGKPDMVHGVGDD